MGTGRTNVVGEGTDFSGVTATPSDVSKAKYYIDSNGVLRKGTVDFAGADATVGQVRSGKKFINSSGQLKTGTLATYTGATSVTPSTSSQTLQTSGKYMDSNITIIGTSAGINSGSGSQNGDGTTSINFTVSGISTSSSIIAWGISASPSAEAVVMAAGSGTGNGSAVFAHNVGSVLQVETGTVKCNGIFSGFGNNYVSFTSNNSSRVFASGVSYSLWVKYQ